MSNEHGEWVIHGLSEDNTHCLNRVEDLEKFITEVGFLPLFQNGITGFSVEERTVPATWWSGDKLRDPWEWRAIIAARGQIAYGKFFDKKAGFISKEWFPCFANYRRDGYDFDARYEDGLAGNRNKKIMDLFEDTDEIYSNEIKKAAGFGKGGEKNFEGVMTELQMQTYLAVRDFRARRNRQGEPFGWPVAVYCTPEKLWPDDTEKLAYQESPEESKSRIIRHIRNFYPEIDEKKMQKVLR